MYARRSIITSLKNFCNSIRKLNYAYISDNQENLVLKINEEKELFPLVWLRDNCKCESCFHSNSTSRIINWNYINLSPKVETIQTTHDKDIVLQWDDRHISKFNIKWLQQRSFRKEIQEKYLIENYRPSKISWSSKAAESIIKKYDYNDIMANDDTLYNWLLDLARYGMVLSENAPLEKHSAGKLAERIAFIRKTHYESEFEIKATPGTSNVAYLSGLLQLHTDLPYYEYIPGATLLHCLVQAEGEGGESLLSDGLYNAEKLRNENAKAFDLLSKIEVNWLDVGQEHGEKYHKIFRSPVIRLDLQENIDKIYHSVPQRDSHFTVDLQYVKPWYEAMKMFVDSLNKEAYQFKLKSGELLAFDNTRLLHGRLSYKDTKQNQRHLIGCYVDWDEIYSKIRVLKPVR